MSLSTRFTRFFILLLLFSLVGEVEPSQAAQPKALPGSLHYYMPFEGDNNSLLQLGLNGGSITVFSASPSAPSRMYAGSWGGGVFRSDDGGLTWQGAGSGLGSLYIQSLAVDPQNADVVYAGTYTYGIYRSRDGGRSWNAASAGLNASAIPYDIVVDPKSPNNVYAGTRSPGSNPPWGGGVYKSTNQGDNWTRQNNGLAEDWVYSLAIDPANPATLYAAMHTQGIARSTDGARSWRSINTGLDDLSGRAVAVDPTNPQTLYFGTWHYGEVFKSTNGGASWQPARNGFTPNKIYKLFIDPLDPRQDYAATFLEGIYKTSNSGGSWGLVGFGSEFVVSMGIARASHSILAGTTGSGLYRTPDGG